VKAQSAWTPRRWLVLLALLTAPVVHAELPPGALGEINYLLGYIDGSGCEFYRNGTWHDSQAAQSHIRDKYSYLVSNNQIDSAEQFIDRAASKSSLTGQPYLVKCQGGASTTTKQWLKDALDRFRTR
jgi:hypothetical protein